MTSGYESAYDIYYTTDGSTPDPSDLGDGKPTKAYSGTLLYDAIKDYTGSAIKAVAKKKSDNAISNVVTLPLVTYTYHIVNTSNTVAISSVPRKEAAGKPLSGYSSIPEVLQSPYISDETITFKSFDGPFSEAALEAADEIHETPTTENIYITYTTGKLNLKSLHLQGVRPFNLKNGSGQYFVNSSGTTLTYDEVNTETSPQIQNKNKDHIWYISGGDSYAVTITCPATNNFLTSTPSVTDTEHTFFIKAEAGSTVTFQDASGSVAVTYNEVKIPTSYYLIDKAGKRLLGPEESTSSSMAIPSEWKSPLATYHYWKSSSFNESDGVYTLKAEQTELSGLEDLGEGDHIYITYDVKKDIDIQGGKTYLMKFSDGAEDFHPEDGDNGVSGTAIKATYPYNNGDFNLYIYGATEWTNQLSNGASTRTRWLWYIISNHDGTDLTGDAIDPYHVIIKSRQNQVYKVGDNSYDGNAYLYTYKPNDGVGVVTGVITQHDVVKTFDPTLKPTEYMLLGTDVNHMTLKTVDVIDGAQQTVNKFEQYWKNYPTVETVAGVANPAADNATLTAKGWHRYQDWAYAEPWGGGTKTLVKGDHWFQTVSMGSGEFSVEEMALEPEVILLDQHGWEIARVPVSQTAKLKKYDSPMVEEYQWYPKANKVSGYHKYTIPAEEAKRKIDVYENSANPDNDNKVEWHVVRSVLYTSNSLSKTPEGNVEGYSAQNNKYKTDFYVTYTVKSDYAGTYVGAASEGDVKASSFFVKQAGKYAQNSSNSIALVDKPALTGDIPTNVQWKVKPNFNIDHEMGYKYLGETGAQPEAESKSAMETAYHAAGKNGFDPYNVQIQSMSNTARYFTTNTGSTVLDHGIWTGSYTEIPTISLSQMSVGHISADGPDHTTLDITNATFMVVDDGNGNMRLMPRFDNTKVMTSFTALSDQLAAAPANNNGEGTQSLVIELVPTLITSTDEILSMKGYYVLAEGFTQTKSLGTSDAPFEGTIDGQLNHFSFSDPLVLYAKNATIRNIILDNIGDLTSGNTEHHLGAIACTAMGETRIYNCGVLAGSLSESGHVGGIVGHLQDYSHVVNCYSYATIEGGSVVGGIVGHNDYASKYDDIRTMVMNCMFYGDITGGSNASPVYGGYNITNLSSEKGLNTFNYYAYEKLKSTTISDNNYHCALAVKDEYLNRFEFYRLLLNSNKKLAAYYASTSTTTVQPSDMAKWVLETADRGITDHTPYPYPILKAQGRYPSIINYDVDNAPELTLKNGRPKEEDRNKGGKLGTLSVTISGTGTNAPSGASITSGSLTLTRTDKDPAHFNFNYDKVQLPYYNDVGEGNYTENRVVTGWKIISMSPTPASDPYTLDNYPASGVTDYPNHNYADRKSVNKDLNSVSGRIFSQGAYFDVPYGVTSITIEPYWGKAAYVADEYLDVTYGTKDNYGDKINRLDKQVTVGTTLFHGQRIEITIDNALKYINNSLGGYGSTVYDNVVVLVGNLHQSGVPSGGDTPFTVMSVDENKDNEPDYSMIYHHNGRTVIAPIRFDFLNIPGTAQAQKPNGASKFYNFTIFKTKGWFETTNTCLVYSNQVEYENKKGVNYNNTNNKTDAPLILLGGDYEQFVSTQSDPVDGKTTYIHVGSNVRIQSFGLGTHGDGSKSTPHIPVSVTGGEYEGFYLSGTYNQDADVRQNDNAECYISGGYFVEAAGASQEKIDGSVTWQIYEADMDAFYGGGVNAAKPITGDVTVNIFNSHVTLYCGGPKFGDMQGSKKVTTNAEGCTFTKFFGGGFGGTSYSRKKYYDVAGAGSWSDWAGKYTADRGSYFDGKTTNSKNGGGNDAQYGKKGIGVATDVDYEFFAWSSGQTGGRFYVNFASFSLAACNDVESNLKGCTINENFYGGGSYGEVKGKATSVLDGCTVHGNVFGGGFSATLPTVKVRKTPAFTTNPKINNYSGMFEPGVLAGFEETEFEWKHYSEADPALETVTIGGKTTIKNGTSGSNLTNHYLYTDVDLTALGKVGATDLTIKGNTSVGGSVFGGGDMSAVTPNPDYSDKTIKGDTKVNIQNEKTEGTQNTILNVYGGGNTADVTGNSEVNMTSGTVSEDIFGGGRGETTVVGGDVTVNINGGTVSRDVYGGSALGAVNATKNPSTGDLSLTDGKATNVNINAGTINGNAFGGGLGQLESGTLGNPGYVAPIVAKNFGVTTVNMEGGLVKTAVYGGANVNGVLKDKVYVNVIGGTVNTEPASTPTLASDIKNVVFGGGYGKPTIVEGNIAVTIGTQAATPDNSKPTVYGTVYGGSALGKVQVSEAGVDQLSNKIDINLYGGTIYGNVFGGGLGQKAAEAVAANPELGIEAKDAVAAVEAKVGGNVNVLLDGAKLDIVKNSESTPLTGQIFGANNLNGTPKGHVKVHVKRTVDSAKPTETARDSRTTYDVAAVYGGGNQADYIPADPTPETPLNDTEDYAEVIIEGCDLTSIEYVYGGGNAAAVPATDITILGSYIIDYVFGGGNGKSTASFTNPGANVGSYNNGATSYGSGKAVTKLVGCHAHYVFGGSNTKGNVREGTSILMPDKTSYVSEGYNCCSERDVREIYGAGNEAEQDGNVTLILGCVSNMKNVYGGARNANVKGGIDLVVTSGSFEGVFGGNDQSGTVQGPITVTIEETGCDPLTIENLYLGGNQAAYSIYGYKNTGTEDAPVLVARTKAEYDELTTEQKTAEGLPYADPVLNVVSCTRIGKTSGEDLGGAFGGGLGSGAVMYGNPTVNINMIPGKYAKDIDRDGTPGADNDATALGIIRNVYGGGEQANVEGNTQVNIGTETTVKLRSDMGAPIPEESQTPTSVLGALITESVFGAGKGKNDNVESALVSGNTEVNICTADYSEVAGFKGISIAKSVYGGGQLSQVGGNTNITVSGGTIGTSGMGGATYGNIYGGGFGHNANVRFGLVKGNTNVTVTGGNVLHSVYGGGAYGSVGTYTYASDAANAAISALASENTTEENTTGVAKITITGGTIGTDGHENGMVFGSSRGDIAAPGAIQDNMAWVYDTKVVIGTENDETPGPRIHGSLYGSGENGHTFHDASVKMYSGTIGNPAEFYAYRGNVYGGGCGTDKYYENPEDETHDGHGTLYNPKAGIVKGNATVEILGGSVANNIYGAGSMGKVEGSTSVTINTDGAIGVDGNNDDGNVYGAARGELDLTDKIPDGDDVHNYSTVKESTVTLTKGTVKGSVYGGGKAGVVTGQVTVQLDGGTVMHDVYGGGALAQTNTSYDAGSSPADTYTTTVNLAGTTINGNLYGGGLGRLASGGTAAVLYADENEYNTAKGTSLTAEQFAELSDAEKTKTPAVAAQAAVAADVNGPVMVSVTSGSVTNVFGCNNLNGAPQTTVDVEIGAKSGGGDLSGSATVSGSVYGGGNMAAYTGTPAVKIYGGTVNTNVYGGGLGATAVTGGTSVTMEGGKVDNDVFGGGSQADVTGSVSVTVTGGKIVNNVYGGGALANTNTANWNSAKAVSPTYDEVSFLKVGVSVVTGLYTESGGVYTKVTAENTKAADGVKYYRQITGGWANDGTTSTANTTTVTLAGGVMGNAYGGGLGDVDTPVYVYGDVVVNVNKTEDIPEGGKGAGFTRHLASEEVIVGGKKYNSIPVTGSVFGCNDVNGTPRGDVTVTVYSTRQLDDSENVISGHSPNASNSSYEIQAVYGGGNQADYQPAAGKTTNVIIRGCDVTSIEKVYGGGNSAAVPETHVTIWGSYDISDAFGGGNGSLPIKRGGVWIENAGSRVLGNTNNIAKGGKIGNVFGGNDGKGSVGGTMTSDYKHPEGGCPLKITKIYGANNEADSDGDVNVVISGCTAENADIEYVCGGSYNANIRGDLTLTITSGIFKNVYGGNDARGSIGGKITVNIQEEDPCKPIIIQNLVGGGFAADYPGEDTKELNGKKTAKRRQRNAETGAYIVPAAYDDYTTGKVIVNVKSATRIDNIYGGGFQAHVNGDTEVNINMVKGLWAGAKAPSGYTTLPNVHQADYNKVLDLALGTDISESGYYEKDGSSYTATSDLTALSGKTYYRKEVNAYVIDDAIGTIGNIYGGGNEGNVYGNTVVNIGNLAEVPIMQRYDNGEFVKDTEVDVNGVHVLKYEDKPVLGAHIYGEVFGGGNLGEVRNNTTVNIGTANYSGTANFEGISIDKNASGKGGTVYGGGNKADVLGNTYVTMDGGTRDNRGKGVYVYNGVFGGGYSGSVGTYTRSTEAEDVNVYGHTAHAGCIGKPKTCTSGGTCTVVVTGGQIGPIEVATLGMNRSKALGGPVPQGWVWGGGCGIIEDPATNPDTHFKTYVNETDVTIGGTAFILESVIGGGEFGRVLGNTLVKIQGNCQIGVGDGQTETVDGVLKPKRYTDGTDYGSGATTNQFIDPTVTPVTDGNKLIECSHFVYGNEGNFLPYDPYYDAYPAYVAANPDLGPASTASPSDGKTWIGCVFGGGSGYMPYIKADGSGYDWCPSAGWVEGNATVQISGGHILTNVYGGNEYTDVGGTATVTMTGGTLGVPRTLAQIAEHPLSCYLFGAGKGDERAHFYNYNNVGNVVVDVSGGIIYGSVFGGAEDGHVLGNVRVDIKPGAKIGTWGTSYVDGNVFGGGRGFSGRTLGAGNVTGNIDINITGGTMLGSIYGGGRMASVGTNFSNAQDPNTGQFIEGDDHGHVTVNISGGTIGNDKENDVIAVNGHTKGGNVFGGSMGRLTKLDGTTPNPLWTKLAQVKTSSVNITGASTLIKSNVYGGAEFGTTRDNVYVTVGGTRASDGTITPSGTPTINGHVYGGGYGSTIDDASYLSNIDAATTRYLFTPMQYAGVVGLNTYVNVVGGHVKRNVYGGGEMASVGIIDYSVIEDASGDITYDTKKYSYINVHKHADIHDAGKAGAAGQTSEKVYGFGLSWPYQFSYLMGGETTVNVSGGRVGTGYDDGTGYVFGGGKGHAFERYKEAHLANVRQAVVNIGYAATEDAEDVETANCVAGAVYGGGEDGHVYENSAVNITGGLIGISVYGGGKGEGTYSGKLRNRETPYNWVDTPVQLPSWTAGKVYGNSSVTMSGGHVMVNVYGGGNRASVGKGNYAGGTDDYYPAGYGETLQNAALWTASEGFNPNATITDLNKPKTMADYFLSSGKSTVTITAGTVGTQNGIYGTVGGTTGASPTGMVFGGSRGKAAEDVGALSPRYDFAPDFFLGYSNNTQVTIGDAEGGPTIYSQVFGGGRDGHVRGSSHVIINNGTIGQAYDVAAARSGADVDYQRYHRGNVYGAGSGLGSWDGTHHGTSSGSVTRNTTVDIYGGTIYNNVYGGGALATVGPPKIDKPDFAPADWSKCTVNIYGGTIGSGKEYESVYMSDFDKYGYGGCIYGASRGSRGGTSADLADGETIESYATVLWTEVNINPHPTNRNNDAVIAGNVYGGAQGGQVKKDTKVNLTGGTITHDAYGGGQGTRISGATTEGIAADVGGNATVELNKDLTGTGKGCSVQRIFGCNDLNGTPKGHVKVHVHATQHKDKETIGDKYALYEDATKKTTEQYDTYLRGLADTYSVSYPAGYETAISSGTDKQKEAAFDQLRGLISDKKYDVLAVYGGGNLAKYDPTDAHSSSPTIKAAARTEVIIDGCALTSIRQVYGGGNAAPVPATDLDINAAYEIDEVFGGGNGKDNYSIQEGANTVWYENPGANVGYENFTHYVKSGETGYSVGTHGSGSQADPYKAIENSNATNKEYRQAYYMYGVGEAKTDIIGGRIHYAYGGSNEKGNISTLAMSVYQNSSDCPVVVDKTYGAGKNADVDAQTVVSMECTEYTGELYGASYGANLNSDVVMNITNGRFGKIFGGNDRAGMIRGSITINIKESSCRPIVIDELYGGGNQAAYSIYGYTDSGQTDEGGKTIYLPRTKAEYDAAVVAALAELATGATDQQKTDKLIEKGLYGYPKHDPRINVISATEIGTIYGGGYDAEMIGSPYVNVNMEKGIVTRDYVATPPSGTTGTMSYTKGVHEVVDATHGNYTYEVTNEPSSTVDAELAIGKIGNIYGGGNLAAIQGNTSVEIGTGKWIGRWDNDGNPIWETENAGGDKYTYKVKTAADYYTQEECNTYNATLTGALNSTDALTADQATAYNTAMSASKSAGDTLTAEEANAYNATLTGARLTSDVKTAAGWAWYDSDEHEVSGDQSLTARNTAKITGNVFGGGKGEAKESGDRAFFCESAMVGVDGDGLIDRNGGTSVTIGNGTVTVGGSVYGGGEIGRVEKNTSVAIGLGDGTGAYAYPAISGSVFGAGKGIPTHGYSALVRGNSTVIIQGDAKVAGSVYGGGEIASVGRYNVVDGVPTSLKDPNSGNCTVIVRGYAEIGPDNMTMFHVDNEGNIVANDKPDNTGHVFGAGKGAMPVADHTTAQHMTNGNTMAGFASEADYLKFIESLGLATQTKVTIGGNAFVKGDIFGGAEQGFVQHDTHVTIEGNCQIGNGYVQMNADGSYKARTARYSLNRRYTDEEWSAGKLTGVAGYENSLPECASWEYGQATGTAKYAAHDIYANSYDSKGGSTIADNGSTFFGNVFGGGSGYFPYKAGHWHWKAGDVGGNTVVDIKGGHVLTNVYGANELTNVAGMSTVNMSGGTIGVPRTLGQIAAHPVTCYLFGGGKGDPRVLFNKQTNVNDVEVNVTGGWVYGSVFGGGEDGHVMRDVTMNIQNTVDNTDPENPVTISPKIGTWGTSYVDGNVFGGGRGFAGDAYTAGNVAGSVNLTISGGTMLGSIYGGGRLGSVGYGLYDAGAEGYGEMRDDDKMDDGTDGTSFFTKGRGHVEINISGGTIGNNREYIIPNATNIAAAGIAETDISKWKPESEDGSEWTTWKTYHHVPSTTYDTSDGKLHHTRGGNVYAGGMGRRENLNGQVISMAREGINWLKLGNVKSTKLTITGGTIKSNVYGGGEYGAVQGNHKVLDGEGNPIVVNEKNVVAGTEIIITGGTIGSEILGNSASDVKYTYGSVFGGGTGTTDDVAMTDPVIKADTLGAYVADSTRITLTNAIVKASVFGGGELSAVGGNTNVNISGTTEIGRNEVRPKSDPNPGYVMFGSWRMGNVYGGGRGSEKAAIAGLVKGNTNINISGGNVYHMVYGGGALGSVGDFKISDGAGNPSYIPIAGIPYDWKYTDGTVINPANPDAEKTPTGTATVTITGGTIGISGRDNGLVFGSSRGGLQKPTGTPLVDPYDRVAWVNKSVVNIGTKGSGSVYTTPLIKGSVYGGGENGHNADSAKVNIYSGTIGIADKIPGTETADPWWDFGDEDKNTLYRGNRGNVYGAGSGSDTYTGDDGKEHYNPKSGMVGRNTVVNIYGGHVGRNVYGGGSMAMVGTITNVNDTTAVDKGGTGTARHTSETTSFALSWPYKFVFASGTGKATVNVTGGHIGTLQTDGGDVYGSSRGEAGDRYTTAHLAYVKETEVNIDYPTTADLPNMEAIQNDFTIPCITGAVHGSGENGYVYGDTKVTLKNGLIGHSLYGGGKGKGTYTQTLNKISGGGTYDAKIYSLIAGKVFGNTYVTMSGGRVGRNVYGGGNMGSVGKGNYASGPDDYYPDGYGEKIVGEGVKLWETTATAENPDNAWEFLNSGKTTVNVIGGTVGYIDSSDPTVSMKNQLPYGNVIGGSAGEAAPNLPASLTENRYLYCPAYYSGYVNETDVTIGGYKCKENYGGYKKDSLITAAAFSSVAVGDTAKWQLVGPTIYASVYGGGQDGHVRRDTKVTVLGGEIGVPYTSTKDTRTTLLKNFGLDDPQWLHRGNVYGGGSGITKYKYDFNYNGKTSTDANNNGIIEDDEVEKSGSVKEEDYGSASGSVTRFTEVNILGGTIHRNVYGGGSMGSVGAPNMGQTYVPYKPGQANIEGKPANGPGRQSMNTINIGGGKGIATIGTPYDSAKGWTYNKLYGGEVYGASRGMSTLDPEEFSTSVWTKITVKNGATIMGNVYGGGDNGAVKKDTDVRIGESE